MASRNRAAQDMKVRNKTLHRKVFRHRTVQWRSTRERIAQNRAAQEIRERPGKRRFRLFLERVAQFKAAWEAAYRRMPLSDEHQDEAGQDWSSARGFSPIRAAQGEAVQSPVSEEQTTQNKADSPTHASNADDIKGEKPPLPPFNLAVFIPANENCFSRLLNVSSLPAPSDGKPRIKKSKFNRLPFNKVWINPDTPEVRYWTKYINGEPLPERVEEVEKPEPVPPLLNIDRVLRRAKKLVSKQEKLLEKMRAINRRLDKLLENCNSEERSEDDGDKDSLH